MLQKVILVSVPDKPSRSLTFNTSFRHRYGFLHMNATRCFQVTNSDLAYLFVEYFHICIEYTRKAEIRAVIFRKFCQHNHFQSSLFLNSIFLLQTDLSSNNKNPASLTFCIRSLANIGYLKTEILIFTHKSKCPNCP